MAAAVLGGVVLAFGGGLATLLVDRGRRAPVMESVELRFGTDVSENAVWGVLGCISGLPTAAQVVLELVGDVDGIRHYLHAEPGTLGILRAHLRGLLPGVRLEPVEPAPVSTWRAAARARWGGRHPLLRSDRSGESAAALLGALSDLHGGEKVMVRWTLRPARGPYLPERQSRSLARNQGLLVRLFSERPIDPAHLPALRSKYSGPVLHARAVVAVTAGSEGRGVNLLTRVAAVLRAQSGLRGHPMIRYCRSAHVQRFVERVPPGKGSRFSPGRADGPDWLADRCPAGAGPGARCRSPAAPSGAASAQGWPGAGVLHLAGDGEATAGAAARRCAQPHGCRRPFGSREVRTTGGSGGPRPGSRSWLPGTRR